LRFTRLEMGVNGNTSGTSNGVQNGTEPGVREHVDREEYYGDSDTEEDTTEDTYTCDMCDYETDTEQGLKVHESRSHEDTGEE